MGCWANLEPEERYQRDYDLHRSMGFEHDEATEFAQKMKELGARRRAAAEAGQVGVCDACGRQWSDGLRLDGERCGDLGCERSCDGVVRVDETEDAATA